MHGSCLWLVDMRTDRTAHIPCMRADAARIFTLKVEAKTRPFYVSYL